MFFFTSSFWWQSVFGWKSNLICQSRRKFVLYDDWSSVGRQTLMGRPMCGGQTSDSRWPVMGQQPVLGRNTACTCDNKTWQVGLRGNPSPHPFFPYLWVGGALFTVEPAWLLGGWLWDCNMPANISEHSHQDSQTLKNYNRLQDNIWGKSG